MSLFPQVDRRGSDGGAATAEPDVLLVGSDVRLSVADAERVAAGCGLVVTGAGAWDPGLRTLVAEAGIDVVIRPRERTGLVGDRVAMATGTDQDLLARVVEPAGVVGAHLEPRAPAAPFLRTAGGAAVGALVDPGDGRGRTVVLSVDLDESSSAAALLHNAVTWCAPAPAAVGTSTHAHAHAAGRPDLVMHPAWTGLKEAVEAFQLLQAQDGSVPEPADHARARVLLDRVCGAVTALAPLFDHDAAYLEAVVADLRRWADEGLAVPDFLDSLVVFTPQAQRVDGLAHLVVFPMYTQNGSRDRHLEAVLVEVIWPDFVAELEADGYSNRMFVPIRFIDFTSGYDTNAAVLFPETIAMRSIPTFTWGAIFADREAARFRAVVRAAAQTTGLALPPDAARLVADQRLAEETFVMWDLIHDRTHMRGDLPFDPFMIKQRMPYFLYALEELRCDLTAFRESVTLEDRGVPHARLVQYAVIFDRIFRFAISGSRVRNYDGLGGQLLFAWLHQHHVLHWTDNRLSIDWERVPDVVLALGREIEDLYWRSIDRPKIAHWLAAYELVSATVTPHPASTWAKGPDALPLDGPLKEMTDAVLPDEFPLSMFYEALGRRIGDVVASTSGITGAGSR